MKKLLSVTLFSLFLGPTTVYAEARPVVIGDINLETVQTKVETAMEETSKITNQAMTYASDPSQALEDAKGEVKKKLDERKKNKKEDKANDVAATGVASTVDGAKPSAEQQEAIENKYTNDKEKDSVEEQRKFEERINEERIRNVSAMYARGLVSRYKLQEEGKELLAEQEKKSGSENQPDLNEKIKEVNLRADKRWITVMQLIANQQEQTELSNVTAMKPTSKPDEEETNSQ